MSGLEAAKTARLSSVYDYVPLTAAERRVHLRNWLRKDPGASYTATHIADASGIYSGGAGERYKVERDLRMLLKRRQVALHDGRWSNALTEVEQEAQDA